MRSNLGKKFEQQWRKSAEDEGVFCLRLSDSDMSFNPNKDLRSRFTVKQPCDFICFLDGNLFCLEMKHTVYKSFSIQRDANSPDGMIHAHQINSLINMSQYDGVHAGFVFNFRIENEDTSLIDEDTYYMSIQNFNNFLASCDKKSINKLDIVQNGGIIIPSNKKRVLFTYGVKEGLTSILQNEKK